MENIVYYICNIVLKLKQIH